MKDFLERLNRCREGMSVSQFARKIGMNQKTVDFYMKGERKPSVELIISVCSKCGVSADWLLGLDGDAQPNIQASRSAVAIGGGDATNSVHPDCRDCPTVARLTKLLDKLMTK